MNSPTKATVVFLRDKDGRICLARKKKAIHHAAGEISYSLGMWNGYGGKVDTDDEAGVEVSGSIPQTAIRELAEESGVIVKETDLIPVGSISFYWPHIKGIDPLLIADMEVYFYVVDIWSGNPMEGNEMGEPAWFAIDAIPYDEMMPGDKVIVPKMLQGDKFMQGALYLGVTDENGLPVYKDNSEVVSK